MLREAQLVAAYEVSGTVGVYDVTLEKKTPSDNNDDNKPENNPSDNNKPEDNTSTDNNGNKPNQNDNAQINSESKDNNSNKNKEENKGLIVNTKDFANTMTLVVGLLGSAIILITLARKKKEF